MKQKRKFIPLLLILMSLAHAVTGQVRLLPDSIFSGPQSPFHVQGIAIDQANGFMYFSFTDRLVKTDLTGKTIGSVSGFIGHLGDIDLSDDGKIYGSLEYKNDAIGKGISKKLGLTATGQDAFYVAIFDAAKITKPEMDAEKEDVLRTVFIKEATDDYKAIVLADGKKVAHRFGCSGIDGLTLAPSIGSGPSDKKYLYLAYGVYGDTTRSDNDHQVILKYDVSDWEGYSKHLSQTELHESGPRKPMEKYFVKTGNTRYGVQNLAYDPHTGNLFAAVYKGAKSKYPNYDLFVIDGKKKPISTAFNSDNKSIKVKTLALADSGTKESGDNGWRFSWGATGICPIGDGLFYISQPSKTKDGLEQTMLFKYRWLGDAEKAFEMVK